MRKRLPVEVFERTPGRLLDAVPHPLVFVSAVPSLRFISPWCFPLEAVLAGHSLACLGFVAHDLSHGAVLAPSPVRPLEFLF